LTSKFFHFLCRGSSAGNVSRSPPQVPPVFPSPLFPVFIWRFTTLSCNCAESRVWSSPPCGIPSVFPPSTAFFFHFPGGACRLDFPIDGPSSFASSYWRGLEKLFENGPRFTSFSSLNRESLGLTCSPPVSRPQVLALLFPPSYWLPTRNRRRYFCLK